MNQCTMTGHVTLKDPGHVDFMLNNLRKYVGKVKEHSEDATVIDDFLIYNMTSPKIKTFEICNFLLDYINFHFYFNCRKIVCNYQMYGTLSFKITVIY
jgi:hypothetical protein